MAKLNVCRNKTTIKRKPKANETGTVIAFEIGNSGVRACPYDCPKTMMI